MAKPSMILRCDLLRRPVTVEKFPLHSLTPGGWAEITVGALLQALFEKGPAEPPSAPSPSAPPSLDKLVSSREPDPPPLHSPKSPPPTASCARVPPKTA